ncbi:imelysin family protein [Halomonas huangheensis]|uniref:Imelysin-like domain-containing protein n=1 Tax=Halomonas huangheensis TaxID=1178482 RepID=W1NCN0_9GAMM|nr:imelysin family protein [Halomonas huangheensis]ALM52765.1 hypothetical protein AR456_11105 [Halomonas huangheensis]ERL52695.1 hypothetical protein BJB45_15560 [Halomonas huangheensis]
MKLIRCRAMTPLTLGILLTVAASTQAESKDDDQEVRQRWHSDIAQRYIELADRSSSLQQASVDYCTSPDEQSRTRLDHRWLDAYQAWQAVRLVDFGPIEIDSRAWQLQFWPDRKNLVGSRMATHLRQTSPLVTQNDIDAAGVAEQGFPALEYLLYDEAMSDIDLSAAQPCSLLQAISGHIADTSSVLAEDWESFGEHYLATDSYTAATLHGAMQLLDTMEDKRLGAPLGMMGSSANHYLAEAWRSDASVALISGSLQGLQQGFAPGLRQWLESRQQSALADAFEAQLADTIDEAQSQSSGIASGLEDDVSRARLATLYLEVAQLRELLNQQIAASLGVVRGFNSSDGD